MSYIPRNDSIMVKFQDVSFSYADREILSEINLQIPSGKITVIFGGSVTGKTTLLKLIAGQLDPSLGEVFFDGQAMSDFSYNDLYSARRRMGLLFQFGALFTDLTVFENVAFPLREHTNLPERVLRDLVILKLDAVGLRGAQNLGTSELSGGMARRVALARAIALDPKLIMYDEPFTGLDPISTGVISNLVFKLNRSLGLSSVLVTHDVEVSLKIADFCVVMAGGKIVGSGTPEEIKESANPYIKQFINGEIDGPVPLHYPAEKYSRELGVRV